MLPPVGERVAKYNRLIEIEATPGLALRCLTQRDRVDHRPVHSRLMSRLWTVRAEGV